MNTEDVFDREYPSSIGLNVFNLYSKTSGDLFDKRSAREGKWYFSLRTGYPNILFPKINQNSYRSTYTDLFAKVDYQITDQSRVSVNLLTGRDDLHVDSNGLAQPNKEQAQHQYSWLTLNTDWSNQLSAKNTLSISHNERSQNATYGFFGASTLSDQRSHDVLGIQSHWIYDTDNDSLIKWGLQYHYAIADYAYDLSGVSWRLNQPAPNLIDVDRYYSNEVQGSSSATYIAYRRQWSAPLIVELGLRAEHQSYIKTGKNYQLAPRFNLIYRLFDNTSLRLAWGEFYQAQGIHQLPVEDGVSEFYPAQKSEHWVVGAHSQLNDSWNLSVDVYKKSDSQPFPRYENYLIPNGVRLPEAEYDRIKITPDRAIAEGLELALQYQSGAMFAGEISYTRSTAEDIISGEAVVRNWDQHQTLNIDLNWQWKNSQFNLVWLYRSGWPSVHIARSELVIEGEQQYLEVSTGQRNAIRMKNSNRLDIRFKQSFPLKNSEINAYIAVINVLDNPNYWAKGLSVSNGSVSVSAVSSFYRYTTAGVEWRF
jgi:TonB dependent receptor-like, beta-barrel